MSKIGKGAIVAMIGRRGGGKSYLVKDLLYYKRDVPIGTVISGTEAGNGFYSSHVPRLFIHEEYNSVLIENVLRRQKVVLKQVQKEMEQFRRTTIDPRAFVILDEAQNATDLQLRMFLTRMGPHISIKRPKSCKFLPPISRNSIQ